METHGGYGALWLRCYRDFPDGVVDRFHMVVREIVGKRLTWNQLTGKEQPSESNACQE